MAASSSTTSTEAFSLFSIIGYEPNLHFIEQFMVSQAYYIQKKLATLHSKRLTFSNLNRRKSC